MDFLFSIVLSLLALVPNYGAGIQQLDPWKSDGGTVRLASTTANLRVPSLVNCDTIDTTSLGVLTCGSDEGGSGGSGFSTTSTDYWKTQRNFFSTTSADYWETQQTARTADDLTNNQIDDLSDVAALSETLGDLMYWNGSAWIDIATSSLGLTFSTTSANYWETQQTARTSDDLTNNSIQDLDDVASITETFGDLLSWDGTEWNSIATSTLYGAGTNGHVLSLAGGVPKWVATSTCLQITGSADLCDGSDATAAGAANPFTWASTFNALNAATSSNLWAQGIFNASSTVNVTGTTTHYAGTVHNVGGVSASESTGGVENCRRLTALGPCYVGHSSAGAGGGRLMSLVTDNPLYDTQTLHVRNEGVDTTLNVIGNPLGRGVTKTTVTFGADSDASVWSGQIDDDDAQGLFLLAPPGYTGKLFNVRIASTTEIFTMDSAGYFGLASTTPRERLSVNGNALISGNLKAASLTATGTITFSALNSANCDLKADTSGVLSCGLDATGSGASFGKTLEFLNSITLAPTTTNTGIGIKSDFFIATSTTATSSIAFGGFAVGTTTPHATSLFTIGTSTGLFVVDKLTGKIGFGGPNTSPSRYAFGVGTNPNINTNINLLVQDATDARLGSCVSDDCIILKSAGSLGLYGFDYAGGLPLPLNLQEFGGNVGIATSTPASLLSVHGNGLFSGNLAAANLNATGTITFAGLNAVGCDLKADTSGVLSCGTDATGAGGATYGQQWEILSGFLSPTTTRRVYIDNFFRVASTSDAAIVNVASFEGDRATPADADSANIDLKLSTVEGNQTIFGRILWTANDADEATSIDGQLGFAVPTTGTLNTEVNLTGSALFPNSSDGNALGTATRMWSDLFVALGSVINFNNGDMTITHSADNLTFAGGTTTIPTLAITGAVSILGEYFTNFTTYVRSLITCGDHVTCTAGDIDVDDDFLLNTGDTGTGTYDFSAATIKEKVYPAFSYATTTAWTGTTTLDLGPAYVAEAWNGVKCFTDTGTLNVSVYDGTNRMNLFNASTTVGTVTLSSNNTFAASEKRYVDIGTPASSPKKISCTVDKTIN